MPSNRPRPKDIFHMYRAVRRGSAADAPMSLRDVVSDIVHQGTAADSRMTMKEVAAAPEIADLSTARIAVSDEAPAIDLPLLDAGEGTLRETGRVFRLADHFGVRPVALIFGSYT